MEFGQDVRAVKEIVRCNGDLHVPFGMHGVVVGGDQAEPRSGWVLFDNNVRLWVSAPEEVEIVAKQVPVGVVEGDRGVLPAPQPEKSVETPEERWARWQSFFFPPETPASMAPPPGSIPEPPAPKSKPKYAVGDRVQYDVASDELGYAHQVVARLYAHETWFYDLVVYLSGRGEANVRSVREELIRVYVQRDESRTSRR